MHKFFSYKRLLSSFSAHFYPFLPPDVKILPPFRMKILLFANSHTRCSVRKSPQIPLPFTTHYSSLKSMALKMLLLHTVPFLPIQPRQWPLLRIFCTHWNNFIPIR